MTAKTESKASSLNGFKNYENQLYDWNSKEKAAVELISSIGNLLYEKSIELVLFRNPLVDVNTSEILNLHHYAQQVVGKPIDIYTTSELAREILKLNDLAPSKMDIGRLASEWLSEQNKYPNKYEFLKDKLHKFIGGDINNFTPRDVVLYGFGRIGRLCARELIKQAGKGQQLRLKAIVTRSNNDNEITKRAALLRMDSVHGPFAGRIIEDLENKAMIINGQIVQMIQANSPDEINYEEYGISNALVIDNTGVYRDREALGLHIKAKGVSKALLTAPGKGDIPNIVYGVNHKGFDLENENVWSAASCTTNAIVPVLKAVEDALGIIRGHIETVHAYTNDQNLLDNYHKKQRRGRSAAINMVITETGAGKAVAKAIPSLKGKLTANAVRVPTPNGSLAIMNLAVGKKTTKEEVNAILKKAALEGDLVNQIKYSFEEELVSNDIIGNTCCSVFDSPATIVHPDGKNIVLYVWYDNEFGYTKQVLRLAKYIAKVQRLIYY
ncbi:MAG: glyceraldehyde-3-phosphate dehydrogenase [Flavobacteriales bacterium]|nr:MAG: glyceraldehyde-3-phosphate dehydrogenase [Flavobacteriales bacterium]